MDKEIKELLLMILIAIITTLMIWACIDNYGYKINENSTCNVERSK